MTKSSRSPVTGRDVAGAGAFMLSVNVLCAAVGAGIGALFGLTVPLAIAGFLIGFIAGRRRFFADIPGHLPLIRKITWWCGGIGLVEIGLTGDIVTSDRRPGPSWSPWRQCAGRRCRLN